MVTPMLRVGWRDRGAGSAGSTVRRRAWRRRCVALGSPIFLVAGLLTVTPAAAAPLTPLAAPGADTAQLAATVELPVASPAPAEPSATVAGGAGDPSATFTMIESGDPQVSWWTATDWPAGCSVGDVKCASNVEMTDRVNAIKAITTTNGGKWPDGHAITPPEGLVINGDLTAFWQKSFIAPYNKDEPGDYRRHFVDGLPNMNVLPGLGNHDYANNVNDCYSSISSGSNGCARAAVDYMRYLLSSATEPNFPGQQIESWDRDSLSYSWTRGNYRFIQMNLYPLYARSEIDIKPSVSWLKAELTRAKAEGRYVILNSHEGTMQCDTGASSQDTCGAGVSADLQAMLASSTVVAEFHGHYANDGNACADTLDNLGRVQIMAATHNMWNDPIPNYQAGHAGNCPASRDKVLLAEFGPTSFTVGTIDTKGGNPTFYKPNEAKFRQTIALDPIAATKPPLGFVAVGVPYEDLAPGNDAGVVDVRYLTGVGPHSQQLSQNNRTGLVPDGGDQQGYAVASGDFNNDGYADLASGSPFDDVGAADAGLVTVFDGTPTGLTGTIKTIRQSSAGGGDEANDRFGSALASGDFNRDGYDDLAVGALGEDVPTCGNDNGAVGVFLGSSTGLVPGSGKLIDQSQIPGTGCAGDDRMGTAVATGDLNGDGYDELVVGLPGKDAGGSNGGAVRIFRGAADGIVATRSSYLDQTGTGVGQSETGDDFGRAVAAGDVNGDGKDDLIVGAPYEDVPACGNDSGELDVVMGSTSWPTITSANAMTQTGTECETDDRFAASLAVGDFNADGRDEVAAGIPGEDINGSNDGRLAVLNGLPTGVDWGNKTMLTELDVSGRAPVSTDRFGESLAAGDANADGVADLAIGVPGGDVDGQGDAGWVHVIPGSGAGLNKGARTTHRQRLLPGRTCSGPSPANGLPCDPPASTVDDGVDQSDQVGTAVALPPVQHVPSSPASAALLYDGNGLDASWSGATSPDGPIDGYELELHDSTTNTNQTISLGVTTSAADLAAARGHLYSFRVRAHNIAGWGPFSAASNVVLAAVAPDAPPSVSGVAGDTQVTVSWSAGGDGGSPISTYTVTGSPGGQTCMWSGGPLTCTIGGLTNGTPYTFTVVATNVVGDSAPSAPSAPVTPARLPGAPVAPSATPSDAQAIVAWSAPASDGGAPITGYTVTSDPDGKTCTWSSGPLTCTVSALTNGTPYTFTVTATNDAGTGPSSAATAPVTPVSGSYFHALPPTRILDSRGPNGGWNAKLLAGTPRTVSVTANGSGIPAGATAVVANVTATGGTANSFLTVYPTGGAVPNASNLNFAAGQTIPNLVTVSVGTGNTISFANAVGATDVVVDVVGYYDAVPADRYTPLPPARILDSRGTNGGWAAKLNASAPKDLQVRNAGGVPATADAVIMNVTVTGGTANSFLTVYPSGGSVPNASNVNFAAGETIPNLVTVKIGDGGNVAFANAVGSVDVIADVVGYYDATTGGVFHPINPNRLLDSRTTAGGWNAKLVSGTPRTLGIAGAGGAGGIAANATAVIGNTTVTGGTLNSFLTVYPAGQAVPNASNVNFAAGQTIPNLAVVKTGAGGQISFNNANGAVHVIFDAVGYFTDN
jgi:hypothetical protein